MKKSSPILQFSGSQVLLKYFAGFCTLLVLGIVIYMVNYLNESRKKKSEI